MDLTIRTNRTLNTTSPLSPHQIVQNYWELSLKKLSLLHSLGTRHWSVRSNSQSVNRIPPRSPWRSFHLLKNWMGKKKQKIYVIDTSVLLHDHDCIHQFEDNHISGGWFPTSSCFFVWGAHARVTYYRGAIFFHAAPAFSRNLFYDVTLCDYN